MSTAITDSPKTIQQDQLASVQYDFRQQTPDHHSGFTRQQSELPIQNANGMTIEARPTGTGKGSVNRKTQFGMMKSKPNKKYKCSCEDILTQNISKVPHRFLPKKPNFINYSYHYSTTVLL